MRMPKQITPQISTGIHYILTSYENISIFLWIDTLTFVLLLEFMEGIFFYKTGM
jgi:hypothetical protein